LLPSARYFSVYARSGTLGSVGDMDEGDGDDADDAETPVELGVLP
jgi:hypothetical protein